MDSRFRGDGLITTGIAGVDDDNAYRKLLQLQIFTTY